MSAGILEFTFVILIAAILGIVLKALRQPPVLAYVLAGIALAFFGFLNINNKEVFNSFLQIGIAFLLFLIGMEINYTALRLVGRTAIIVGAGQMLFTAFVGFPIARALGFDIIQALYLAIALTFSSAIIAVKFLSESRKLNSLYGKISLGVVLVQSIAAIAALFAFSGLSNTSGLLPIPLLFALGKGAVLFLAVMYIGRKIIPALFDKIANSRELLFITSIAWCFGAAALAAKAGFPMEIGGFLAGIALASSSERLGIAGQMKALKDFFVLVFFAMLGAALIMLNWQGIATPLVIFSLFVLIGNPLAVMILLGIMGYRKRTSFFVGLTVAQVSEFSLVFAGLGLRLGHLQEQTASLIIAVAIATIVASSYLMTRSGAIYRLLSPILNLFESQRRGEESESGEARKPIVLVGFDKLGESIALNIPKQDLLVVDFNPDVVRSLQGKHYTTLFGDIADENIIERVVSAHARLLICTSPSLHDNLALVEAVRKLPSRPTLILRAENENDARTLYARKETDYVIVPRLTEGQYLGKTIAVDPALKILPALKKKDLEALALNRDAAH